MWLRRVHSIPNPHEKLPNLAENTTKKIGQFLCWALKLCQKPPITLIRSGGPRVEACRVSALSAWWQFELLRCILAIVGRPTCVTRRPRAALGCVVGGPGLWWAMAGERDVYGGQNTTRV